MIRLFYLHKKSGWGLGEGIMGLFCERFVTSLVRAVHIPLFYCVIIEFDRRVREIAISISYSYTSNVLTKGTELPFFGEK